MIFDPMIDYGNLNMKDERNSTLWNFGELIKTLITISSDADRQREIIGMGAVADEMAIDFDNYYSLLANTYLKYGLISEKQKEKLDELDYDFEIRSGKGYPKFWHDDELDTSADWKAVRKKAKEILIDFGYDNLSIEFEREETFEYTLFKKRLIVQWTKTKLVKKDNR